MKKILTLMLLVMLVVSPLVSEAQVSAPTVSNSSFSTVIDSLRALINSLSKQVANLKGTQNTALLTGANTSLSTAAAALSQGQWVKLTTQNSTGIFTAQEGGYITEYTNEALWDPTRGIYYVAGGARGFDATNGNYGLINQKWISYDEGTNAWTNRPQLPLYLQGHSYEWAALNPATGDYYIMIRDVKTGNSAPELWQYNPTSGTWTKLTYPPQSYAVDYLEFYPELGLVAIEGGLNRSTGLVNVYKNGTWSTLSSPGTFSIGGYHVIGDYNPVQKVLYFGGGEDYVGSVETHPRNFYKLDATGKVTRLADLPVASPVHWVVTAVDPVTGNFLLFPKQSTTFYEYVYSTNTWVTRTNSSAFRIADQYGNQISVASAIPEYGVIMFANAETGVWLYKHSAGSGTPVTPTNGSCGTSNGTTLSTAPTTNLCTLGTASSVTTNTGTYTWTCGGLNGGTTASCSATRTTTTPVPTVTLTASQSSITSGQSSTLTWSSTNSTSCTASGGWTGAKTTSGTQSVSPTTNTTYTLACTGAGGTGSQSTTVSVGSTNTETGLDFPSNASVPNGSTVRFKFTDPHLNGLPIYGPNGNGVTYIWRIYPRFQPGYYTTFFWGNDDGQGNLNTFRWKGGSDPYLAVDSYYGAHPYPRGGGDTTSVHDWEISVDGNDYVNGQLGYNRWYTQALRVWSDASGKHHEFYWDLPNVDAAHRVVRVSPTSWGNVNPPQPALTWGDAPWAPGNEMLNGVLRGMQIYNTNLSLSDIVSEVNAPLSTQAGGANIWYLNVNPTPTDISDKSGKGNNPTWVGTLRPTLYSVSTTTSPTPVNGSCGTTNGTTVSTPPTTNLCTLGTASTVTTNTGTYTWTCGGLNGGTTASCSATRIMVTPAPTVTLSASQSSITSGQSSTLTWSSTNSTSCTASGGWTGAKATSGTQAVSPTTNTTYTLACTGSGGSATSSVSIAVNTGTVPTPTAGLSVLTLTPIQTGTFPYMATIYPLEGLVPNGQVVRSASDGNLRSSVLSRWPDGSASVMVLSGETSVTANTPKTITLSSGAPQGTALTAAAIQAILSSVSVNVAGIGVATISNFTTPEKVWWSNERQITARYRTPVGTDPTLEAVIDVHAFSGGRAFVEVVLENAKVNAAGTSLSAPANKSYTATLSVNGNSVATINSASGPGGTHQPFRAWYTSYWVGGNPGIEVTHDTASLQAHPLLAKMWKAGGDMSTYASDLYTPWSTGRHRATGMGGAGDHPSIGPLTLWDTRYLQTGNVFARRAVVANALAMLSYNINYRDSGTGKVPAFGAINGKVMGAGWPSNGSEPAWEVAHHPAEGLVAFLVQPSPHFIEIAQKIAVWNATWSGSDNGAQANLKNICGYWYQTRGKAWCVRSLAHAIFLTPDGEAWKTDARALLDRNRQLLDAFRFDSKAGLGFVWDYAPNGLFDMETSIAGFQQPLWEHHYLAIEAHKAASAKLLTGAEQSNLEAFADWAVAQPVRFVNESTAGEWRAQPYKTTVGRSGTTIDSLSTWGEQMAWSYSDAPPAASGPWLSNGGSPTTYGVFTSNLSAGAFYPSYFWAALVAAVERNVPGAVTAWNKVNANITNLSTWGDGFVSDPRWGVYPRAIGTAPVNTPTVTLTASPTSVTPGGTATLTWSSTNSTSCTASGGWTGAKTTSGTQSVTVTQDTTYTLTCTGANGTASQSVTVTTATPTPTLTLTLTAFPTSVTQGTSTILNWSTTDATSCTASGGWTGTKTTTGSQSVTPNTTTTYTLTCTGAGGTIAQSVTVTVIPTPSVTLSAAPSSITTNQTATLTWSSTNSTSCTASGGWTGAKTTSGTFTTPALTQNTTYTLTCTGAGGSATQNTTVTVSALPSPTVVISASPSSIAYGGTSVVTWSSTNSTSCTVSNGGTGTSGSFVTPPLTTTTTYTATCTGSGGSASQGVTVSVAPQPQDTTAPTVSLTAPASGVTVSGGAVVVSADASDNVGVTGVQFTLDGQNLGTEDTTAPYSITWSTTLLPDGTYTIGVRARDAKGNTGTGGTRTVTVKNTVVTTDATPPTVTITEPGNGTTIGGSAVALSVNATDNVGVTSVQFTIDGQAYGAPDTTFPYGVLLNTNTLTNGTHTIGATAKDAQGNQGTAANVTVTVNNQATIVDTEAPTVPQSLTIATQSTSDLSLTWALSADNVGVTGYHVERCSGTTCTDFREIGISTGNGYKDSGLSSGSAYRYRVRATDAAKNLSGYSELKAGTTEKRSSGGGGGGGSKKKKNATTILKSGVVTPDSRTNLLLSAQAVTQSSGSGTSFRFFTETLSLGQTSPQVRMLQELLRDKGILTPDSVTGFYGQLTMAGVKKYQCMKGIACSGTPESNGYGMVGQRTRAALNAERGTTPTLPTTPVLPTTPTLPTTPPYTPTTGGTVTTWLFKGMNHPQVATLQQFLMKSGYLTPDTPTTFFGNLTESALKRFQCEKLQVCAGTPDTTGYGATGPRTRGMVR